jgi:hypothetical protein
MRWPAMARSNAVHIFQCALLLAMNFELSSRAASERKALLCVSNN